MADIDKIAGESGLAADVGVFIVPPGFDRIKMVKEARLLVEFFATNEVKD